MSSLAIVLAATVAFAPTGTPSCLHNMTALLKGKTILIAQQYGDNDPHGVDPHGPDPHDEQHDPYLPANYDATGQATTDVYGGKYPNTQQPNPDPTPWAAPSY